MVKEITVAELKRWQDEGIDFQLIDVREHHEYASASMGGELIPLGSLMQERERVATQKPVVIHCRSGVRSANAIISLQQFFPTEYNNLYNLKGGIMAWANEIDPTLRVS